MAEAKHVNGKDQCPACERKLLDAHSDLALWFREQVKPAFAQAHISWSYRGKADQEKFFLDGRTKLHFPNSAHNKTNSDGKPCALALDLFELDYNGIARWAWGFFRDIAEAAQKTRYPIFWGGHWTHLSDADHFQLMLKDQDAVS
jgi:hypothetical protein